MTTSTHSRIPDSWLRLPWHVVSPRTIDAAFDACTWFPLRRCRTLCPTQGYCQPGWSR